VITVSRSDRGAGADSLGPLSALAAKRDGPEQLDLAGLDMAAPARAADAGVEGRRATSGSRRESDRPGTRGDGGEELHIVMTVMARGGEKFSGDRLRHALEHADLCHGEMNIFHRYEQPGDQRTPTLFSAANVLAPGYFEPERMDSISSPGIAMFMRLPGPESPADAFQQMLDAAKTVARDLNGTLCDETRSTLTPQSINHLRERIADFGRRQMLKA
jgi:cell division protein ZipA